MAQDGNPQYFGKDLEAMSFARNYHRWILSEFSPFLGKDVAEVGAGVGNISTLLLESAGGMGSLRAYEPSGNMFPLLQRALANQPRAQAVHGFFGKESAAGRFDSVLYINVLEHVEDDVAELRMVYESLNPGGYLLVFVPALPWLYSDLDRQVGHFRRYLKKDLVDLVESAQFSVEKIRYFDIAGILPWYINFVLLGNSIGGGSVSLYDGLVVPVMRVVERFVTPPIGKNLLLIARKL